MENRSKKQPICPICSTVMTIKEWKSNSSPFYSIYCRRCEYGLKDAFTDRNSAIKSWYDNMKPFIE